MDHQELIEIAEHNMERQSKLLVEAVLNDWIYCAEDYKKNIKFYRAIHQMLIDKEKNKNDVIIEECSVGG